MEITPMPRTSSRPPFVRAANFFVASATALVVPGCLFGLGEAELYTSRRVERQHEAGSVHFAVLSVSPWEEVASSLQPKFELDEDGALEAVVPTTKALEESVLKSVQAAVGVRVVKDGANESNTKENTAPSAIVEGADRTQGAPSNSVLDEPQGMDPFLRYSAATALLQEVRLLNRYISDAAVRRGCRAYAVRMQIALLPSARNEPYDAYATIAFFTEEGGTFRDPGAVAQGGAPDVILRGMDEESPTRGRAPHVIPLLATDNLEGAVHSRTVDDVKQMAGALFFAAGPLGLSGDVQEFTKNLQGVMGRDLNALLTVARVSDNSIRVRLGAMQQAASNYAMVPRTHNITVLVLAPEGSSRTLRAVAKTVLIDAETGKPLAERTSEEIDLEAAEVATRYGLASARPGELSRLLSFAHRNDQAGYFAALEQVAGREFRHGHALWLDLVGLMAGGRYAATEIELPRDEIASLGPPADQTGLLLDDGETHASVTLITGVPIRPGEFAAVLNVRKGGKEFPLAAERADYAARDRVVLIFPSLKGWGLSPEVEGKDSATLTVAVRGIAKSYPVLYRLKGSKAGSSSSSSSPPSPGSPTSSPTSAESRKFEYFNPNPERSKRP
jgi:hypothetical protein